MVLLIFFYCLYVVNNKFIRERKPNLHLIAWLVLIFIALVIMGIIRHEAQNFSGLKYSIYWTLTVSISNLNDIIFYFQHNEYRRFATILNDFLVAIPGFDSEFFGNELKHLLKMNFKGEGVTVTAPGEGYANLGLFGVGIHASILGGLCAFAYRYLVYKGTIVTLLLLAFISLNIWRVATGGIMPMIIFSLAPIAIVYIIFIAFIKKGKI